MKFDGKYAASFGDKVPRTGHWIIYGDSGHGKTTFCMQLAKYLCKFGRVAYNTLEEGPGFSFQNSANRITFTRYEGSRIQVICEDVKDLWDRLASNASPDIVIIDSLQFSSYVKSEIKKLDKNFPNKLFIWISHQDGSKPQGAIGKWLEFAAHIKIPVEGFRAFPKSRFGGNDTYDIDETRAANYHGEMV